MPNNNWYIYWQMSHIDRGCCDPKVAFHCRREREHGQSKSQSLCCRQYKRCLNPDGRFEGWLANAKQNIPPSSALATTTKNNNPATPVLEPSVAALILATSPAAIEHHPVSSKDKIILSAVLLVAVIASTASFILWFRCKRRRAAQSKQDPSPIISEGESGSASPL